METEKQRFAADWCSYVNDDGSRLTVEVLLPGVKKDEIKLKLLDDSFAISAPRDDIEYVAAGGFCCPIKPDEVNAKYDNGLLKIEAPFKDVMEGAVDVTIQ
jgi:HSP20 family protein